MSRFHLLFLPLALAACAAPSARKQPVTGADDKASQAGTQLAQAATSPLSDLNPVCPHIPAVLATAQARPYAFSTDRSCATLGVEIQALNAALGADLDVANANSEAGPADQSKP